MKVARDDIPKSHGTMGPHGTLWDTTWDTLGHLVLQSVYWKRCFTTKNWLKSAQTKFVRDDIPKSHGTLGPHGTSWDTLGVHWSPTEFISGKLLQSKKVVYIMF